MYNPFGRNNCSTSSVPLGGGSRQVTSRIKFIPNNIFTKGFYIEADWSIGKNFKKVKRAYKCGGMNKCNFMRFFILVVDEEGENFVELVGLEREQCIWLVQARIKRNLGIDFTNGTLFRSRFHYACTFPDKCLIGLEVHHINRNNGVTEYNLIAQAEAAKHGITLDESWLKGTDDRICNLIALTPDEHRAIHKEQDDEEYHTEMLGHFEPDVHEDININPLPLMESISQPPEGGCKQHLHLVSECKNDTFTTQNLDTWKLLQLAKELGIDLDVA